MSHLWIAGIQVWIIALLSVTETMSLCCMELSFNLVISIIEDVTAKSLLSLQEAHSLSVLMYAAPALHLSVKQTNELNVCWNMVYRRMFRYNRWESVRAVIDGCGRLDVRHLILLRKIQFYKRIFYMNDSVLHKPSCALLSTDSMFYTCMISVFTCDAARNIYMQFRADLTDWGADELTQWFYFSVLLLVFSALS